MTEEIPRLLEGAISIDDRGSVSYVNSFGFDSVRRAYLVENHAAGFIRAWHAHRREAKFVQVVQGAAIVAAVRIDDWANPSKHSKIHRHALSANKPAVLYIPAGYGNGFKSLTANAKLMFFSTSTLDESRGDDVRFPAHHWDPWTVEER